MGGYYENKLKVLVSLILAVLLIVLVIVKGIDRRSDSEKFVNEYERLNGKDYVEVKMPKVKNIEYVSFSEIEDMIGGKTSGAIILASSKDNASRKMVPIFIDAANSTGVEHLYYYDFLREQENNTNNYKKILKYLNLKEEKAHLPIIIFLNEGKIVEFFTEKEPAEYTEKEEERIFNEMVKLIHIMLDDLCEEGC